DPARLWLGIGSGTLSPQIEPLRRAVGELRDRLPGGVRIVIAAMRPRLCRLGGEIADGVLLNWMLPDGAAQAREGVRQADAPGGRLTSTNPARTDEVVAEVLLGDAQTFEDACRAARAAQREWAAVPAPVRGRVIANVGRLVEQNKEALSRLVTQEVGKPYAESIGEVQEIIDT